MKEESHDREAKNCAVIAVDEKKRIYEKSTQHRLSDNLEPRGLVVQKCLLELVGRSDSDNEGKT